MKHLRLACRALSKSPLVTAVAVLSLALGIGANAAIFSLFEQILLRPLPVHAPEELVNLGAPGPKPGLQSCNQAGGCERVFSYPMFRDLERAGTQAGFGRVAAHRSFGAHLTYRGQPMSGTGMLVSGSYFPALGLAPAAGRLIGPQDDRVVGEAPVAVIAYDFWRVRFNEDPAVVGQAILINGHPLTIVGVAPEGFRGTTLGSRPHVFVPITLRGLMEPGFDGFENRRAYWLYVFARLAPGATIDRARAAINVPYRRILAEVEAPLQTGMSDPTKARFLARQVTLEPGARGQSGVQQIARTPLVLLLAVTGVVLLIACANIANLLLTRAAGRAGEMAVRVSLGASRWRLVAQLLLESGLLAAMGGGLGLIVAHWTLAGLGRLLPPEAVETVSLTLDPRAMLFAAALALGTGVLVGLFPALHGSRPDLVAALKDQAGRASGARAAAVFRVWLVTTQIALAMALLGSAGLFIRSLANVSRVDLGFDADQVVTFGLTPMRSGYSAERALALFQRVEEELAAVPGVTAAAGALVPLIAGDNWGTSVRVEGFEAGPDTDVGSRYNQVGPGYLRTVGIALLAGREFTPADAGASPRVAIVNEAFARKFNLGRQVVGRRMGRDGREGELDTEIVGLMKDAKYSEVKEPAPPLFFTPYRQERRIVGMQFYVRTALPPEQMLAAIPQVIARLDPNLPVEELKTLPQQIRENIVLDRMIGILSAAFAALATLLAAVGLYGVLAFTVAQRTREIGVRMALGADAPRVRRMVLGQVARLLAIGGALGLAAAAGLGRAARSLLFELDGHDPTVLAASAVLLVLVGLGAGLVPALRASRIEPMAALRHE